MLVLGLMIETHVLNLMNTASDVPMKLCIVVANIAIVGVVHVECQVLLKLNVHGGGKEIFLGRMMVVVSVMVRKVFHGEPEILLIKSKAGVGVNGGSASLAS